MRVLVRVWWLGVLATACSGGNRQVPDSRGVGGDAGVHDDAALMPTDAAGDLSLPDAAAPGDATGPNDGLDVPPPAWSVGTSVGAPAGRANTGMVWTGAQVVVWGGGDFGFQNAFSYNSGGRYDPSRDAWTGTSIDGAPSPRYQPLTAWSGKEVIVWGGSNSTVFLNDGALYDPATDRWRPMSTVGSIANVGPGSGVWTGQVLFVFNGRQGGLYDPTADSWVTIPDPPTQIQLVSQSTIWTGSDFISWGGTDGGGTVYCLNTGLRYHPATNVWTPVTTVGVPTRRCFPKAQWSGTEMLVFGGNNESGFLADGARYNPSTDTWRPMSTLGALSPRSNHSVVWTGSKLLIWGGNDNRAVFSTGAAYDPAADAWSPFNVPLTISPRYDASAVWTGTEMIIWGGAGATQGSYPSPALRFRP